VAVRDLIEQSRRACSLHVMTLAEQLESLMTRALAITMGRDADGDAGALLTESNPLWSKIAEQPAEMLPVVTALAATLAAELANAPDEVKSALAAYRDAAAEARFDWIEPPRAVVAFVFLDALERIRDFCASKTI
jgi:hypothetical protein